MRSIASEAVRRWLLPADDRNALVCEEQVRAEAEGSALDVLAIVGELAVGATAHTHDEHHRALLGRLADAATATDVATTARQRARPRRYDLPKALRWAGRILSVANPGEVPSRRRLQEADALLRQIERHLDRYDESAFDAALQRIDPRAATPIPSPRTREEHEDDRLTAASPLNRNAP